MLGDNFIREYYLEDLSICDRFIDYFESNKEKHGQGFMYTQKMIVDTKQKESTDINLNMLHDRAECDILQDYEKELILATDKYIEEFEHVNKGSAWAITENFNIQKYKPGQGFKAWHSERNQPNNDRMLVFMTYLNDVDDGGTEFFYQKYKTKAKKGLTVIWPVDWTYTHRGIVSNTKTKYIATGWFSYVRH